MVVSPLRRALANALVLSRWSAKALEMAQWPTTLRVLELDVAHRSVSAGALLELKNMRVVRIRTGDVRRRGEVSESARHELRGGSMDRNQLLQFTQQNPELEELELLLLDSQLDSTPAAPVSWVHPLPKCTHLTLSTESSTLGLEELKRTIQACPRLRIMHWCIMSGVLNYHSEQKPLWRRERLDWCPNLVDLRLFTARQLCSYDLVWPELLTTKAGSALESKSSSGTRVPAWAWVATAQGALRSPVAGIQDVGPQWHPLVPPTTTPTRAELMQRVIDVDDPRQQSLLRDALRAPTA